MFEMNRSSDEGERKHGVAQQGSNVVQEESSSDEWSESQDLLRSASAGESASAIPHVSNSRDRVSSEPVQSEGRHTWSKFTRCLFDMASSSEHEAAIGFSPAGDMLEVRNPKILEEIVLPKYYRHGNYSSFVRQLNNYGFKTIPSMKAKETIQNYRHEYFKRGRLDLLALVARRPALNVEKASSKGAKAKLRYENEIRTIQQREAEMVNHLRQLEEQNRRLILENNILHEENKRMKSHWMPDFTSSSGSGVQQMPTGAPLLDMSSHRQSGVFFGQSAHNQYLQIPDPPNAGHAYRFGVHPNSRQQPEDVAHMAWTNQGMGTTDPFDQFLYIPPPPGSSNAEPTSAPVHTPQKIEDEQISSSNRKAKPTRQNPHY